MTDQAISPLRLHMIEDMTVRKFVEKTQKDYIRHVKNLTAFLGGFERRPPEARHRSWRADMQWRPAHGKIRWRLFRQPCFTQVLQNVLKGPVAIVFTCPVATQGKTIVSIDN